MPATRWWYAVRAWLVALTGRRHADDDLQDEIAFHLEMQIQENLRAGASQDEAVRRARIALGGVDQTKETVRDGRPLRMLATLLEDAQYALRLIRRAPGFATVTLLTIALGVGANTAIFSVVNGVLLRPLPYFEPDSLMRMYLANPVHDTSDGPFSVLDLDDWRARARSFESITGYLSFPTIHTGSAEPVEIQTTFVLGDFFGTLGVRARLGRALTEDDVRRKIPNVVISERLWQTRFGGDETVLGRAVSLSAISYTIVGVMSGQVRFPTPDTDIWAPHSVLSDEAVGPRGQRFQRGLAVLARLATGVTVEQAQSEATAVAGQLAAEFPNSNKGWTDARVVPLRTTLVGKVDTALLVVLAVVGVILLIACANLANLFLARGTARAHEMATRAALGAGRLRIVRQLLTDSLVLGIAGGILGIALSFVGVQALLALSADTLPRVEDVRIDGRVIGYGLLLTVMAALLFGILPALRAARVNPRDRLRADRGAIGGHGRLGRVLIVTEVALALVLIVGAGLMTRSFLALRAANPGFDPHQVVAVTVQFNLEGVSGDLNAHLIQRRERLVEVLRALPGVVEAGSIRNLPLEGECSDTVIFLRADGSGAADGSALRAPNCLVSAGYLRAMRIPVVRGEPLPDHRAEGAPWPFVISESAARRFWPGQDPIGQMVRANYGGRAVVVGIVGDVRQQGLAAEPSPVVYFQQRITPRIATTVVLRAAGDPMMLAGPIRAAIRALDPKQPVRSITTLDDVMAESIARDRFFTLLFGLFGGLALLLAAVGVYGVLAYSVGQRTREMGVRIALGAQIGDVRRMVVGEGMRLVLAGAALGGGSALLLTRALESQLHRITATDPVTFLVAPAVLVAVALVACYLPARRATRGSTAAALRGE
ncbi:ABC transporter permease [soil metagenome]